MTVLRIVPNLAAEDPRAARAFYQDFLGLDVAMDEGWVMTFAAAGGARPQVSVASQGGSGTELPVMSIEVDDIEAMHRRALSLNLPIVYGPVDEPWGVRRFYLRDPFGNLVNILAHT